LLRLAPVGGCSAPSVFSKIATARSLESHGDYAGAKLLYERALAIREKALGAEHPDTGASLNNLAGLLRAQGDYEGAKPLYQRALAIHAKALGAEHPSTKIIRKNLDKLGVGYANTKYQKSSGLRRPEIRCKSPRMSLLGPNRTARSIPSSLQWVPRPRFKSLPAVAVRSSRCFAGDSSGITTGKISSGAAPSEMGHMLPRQDGMRHPG
jgi:Tetratricopeptide repeat